MEEGAEHPTDLLLHLLLKEALKLADGFRDRCPHRECPQRARAADLPLLGASRKFPAVWGPAGVQRHARRHHRAQGQRLLPRPAIWGSA